MIGFLIRRLLRSVVVVTGAAVVVFVILRLAPGDPALLLLGQNARPEDVEELRMSLGLNEPLPVQLMAFLANAARGDFGDSLTYRRPALDLVLQALPATLALSAAAFAISVMVAIPVGIISATRRGTLADHLSVFAILLAQSAPPFWIGILLIFVFSVLLHWFPTSGAGGLQHLVLPAVTLATFQLAVLARTVRSGMLEVLGEDYIRTARAKGLAPITVIVRHAFRNTLILVVTVLVLQLGALLAGAITTEAVFAWPGLGTLAIRALSARDYPLVQAIVLFSSLVIVVLAFLGDVTYAYLDPRVRG